MSILNSRIYYINTENKASGTNSNFTYNIKMPVDSDFDSVCVLQASIPLSFYLVQDGVNTFTLRETFNGSTWNRTVTIPIGNYNYQTFQQTILNLLHSNGPLGLIYP